MTSPAQHDNHGASPEGIPSVEFFIVWNEARNEGFITDDESDALACLRGGECSGSTAGLSFAEIYDDDERTLERHTLKALGQ